VSCYRYVDVGGGVRYEVRWAGRWYVCDVCGMDIYPKEKHVAEVIKGRWKSRVRRRFHIYCFNRTSRIGYVVLMVPGKEVAKYRLCREEVLYSDRDTAQ